ncbi:MAG: helicase-related protein [Pseudomonadota bacterium]
MARSDAGTVTAVLGPTNTGKTHLAIERMCAHSSGMIGFPLRLLAREVYDRVVALKGANRIALVTGEEKIVPKDARWWLCTAESMPAIDVGFVALDEAQLGADPERGHVFTDRLLNARGRDETMILGSDSLRPLIRALVPEAEVVTRPRFSTLSYAGACKLSRLPRRSAVVAFSAEEVYAVAEMLRRLRGGAAVVMGALSPRTRNAQVAMFQAGEVDYLVATDAIGMGLNLDVAQVAFAGLHKFDGHRRRRLTVAEMAQIAGRAGRHQRDGGFGALAGEGPDAFEPEEIHAIEEHRFARLDHLYWRDGDPDLSSVESLIHDLERRPTGVELRAAPQAIDLKVLKRIADEPAVAERARTPAMVARLWAACGVPDFGKAGVEPHARFVARLFGHLSEGNGHIPHPWFAEQVARLDRVEGDVDTIAGRIAGVRTWAYLAHRADWLANPADGAARAGAVEERLSDALHARLTQRFVDKRTSVLMRGIANDAGALPVTIASDGEVSVEEHPIGRLEGFRFVPDAAARASDRRLLLAAAEKRLAGEYAARGRALADCADASISVRAEPVEASFASVEKKNGTSTGSVRTVLIWEAVVVASLDPGRDLATPKVRFDRALDVLTPPVRTAVLARLERWLGEQAARQVPGLVALSALARDPAAGAPLRAAAGALLDAGGIVPRRALGRQIEAIDPLARKRLRAAGTVIGTLDVYDPRLLKPAAAAWRQTLLAVRGRPLGEAPAVGATVLSRGAPGAELTHGFRPLGAQAVRVDLVERIARGAHEARAGRKPFAPDPALATSIGLTPETFARLMAQLGFRALRGKWLWQGLTPSAPVAPPRPGNAFAALADLTRN